MFTYQKELIEYQLKSIRFERNYELFKNSLIKNDKTEFPQIPIVLGNKKSQIKITIISNPFCSHCKDVHDIIEAILENHHKNIQVQVVLKTNFKLENEINKKLFRNLMNIYMKCGEIVFLQSLKSWFDDKNLVKWFNLFPIETTDESDYILNSQYKWCEENDYNFTPAIFVNGFEYPKIYDRKNLLFFINEIIEDEF